MMYKKKKYLWIVICRYQVIYSFCHLYWKNKMLLKKNNYYFLNCWLFAISWRWVIRKDEAGGGEVLQAGGEEPQQRSRYKRRRVSLRSRWYDLTSHSILVLLSPNTFPSNVTSHNKRSSNQFKTPQSLRSERHPLSFLDKHIVVLVSWGVSWPQALNTSSTSGHSSQHTARIEGTRAVWLEKSFSYISHFLRKTNWTFDSFCFSAHSQFYWENIFHFQVSLQQHRKAKPQTQMMIKSKQQW